MAGTVYVLGAGFSRPAGGPLIRDFMDPDWVGRRKRARIMWGEPEFEVLRRILHDLPDDEQTIESALNTISSAALFGARFGRYSHRSLLRFAIDYVSTCVEEGVSHARKNLLYERFFNDVLQEDVALITTNYDLIPDIHMMARFGSFHYGLPANKRYRYLGLRHARFGPPLLKLHGSLSWLRCKSCKTIWLSPKYIRHRTGLRCLKTSCQGTYEILIVPPMWNKEAAARALALVWAEAYRQLSSAARVVVIGYSFPTLDRAALDLFRTALSKNHRASLEVHSGSSINYADLASRIGHKIQAKGLKLEQLVDQSQG